MRRDLGAHNIYVTSDGNLKLGDFGLAWVRDADDSDDALTADLVHLAHELAVHQIELEIQNDELRRTQVDAQEARDRYLDLYDFAPLGYVSLDAQGVRRTGGLVQADGLSGTEAERVAAHPGAV